MSTSPIAPPVTFVHPVPGPTGPGLPVVPVAPAPVAVPAPAAAPAGLPPLIDFPGIVEGDRFGIARGSRVGAVPVRGTAAIARLDDEGANFAIRAGALGVRVDVEVNVERIDADRVLISSRGRGIPDFTGMGEVVESRPNYVEFRSLDHDLANTIIQHDGAGRLRIDGEIPDFGNLQLLLDRQ